MAETFERIWIDAGGTNVRAYGEHRGRRRRLFAAPAAPDAVASMVRRVRGRVAAGGEIVVGMRGVWTAAEKSVWKRKLKGGRARVRVTSDIELAHAMAFPDGVGIVLNAGTGSIAYGRNAAGMTARAGGLGPLIGDEGSAFWIGKEYLKRVEGKYISVGKLRAIAVRPDVVAAIAGYARRALKAARREGEAQDIVEEAKAALRRLVAEVQIKLGGRRLPLALRGGLFDDLRFRRSFSTRNAATSRIRSHRSRSRA